MKTWGIGEVARLLGVKAHVLRYWESELPLLSPRKGASGRRVYSAGDIRLLMRFRHLLYEKRYTIEGARKQIWEELSSGDPDVAARFAEVRTGLIEALMTVRGRRAPGVQGEVPEGARAEVRGDAGEDAPRDVHESEGDEMNERDLTGRFTDAGQGHLFAHWDDRPARMKQRLLEDLATLDLALVTELREALAAATAAGAPAADEVARGVTPAPFVPLDASVKDAEARASGEESIRRGHTALLTVAGGQGSRLGYDGPKGMFPVTPIRQKTLFELFAEKLLAARRWYGAQIPWLIMTGPHNNEATLRYFEEQHWFGLGRETVTMFVQGSVPSLSPEGRLLLAPDGGLFFNPNGHGGVVEALRGSGALTALRQRGVDHLFYFQVDNPLVRVPDPVFLGFHSRARSRVSSKVIAKAYPEEKLGVIVERDGIMSVIEYSDLDPRLMQARTSSGRLLYEQGSIAIHILETAFIADPGLKLPWHVARKKAEVLNPVPGGTETVSREAVKMERFVFDLVPLAERALFFETDRAEEFAPLKNREGLDSTATCRDGQVEQAARWLTACGVQVPRDAKGRPAHTIEISPLFAMDPAVLAARRGLVKDRIDEDTLLARTALLAAALALGAAAADAAVVGAPGRPVLPVENAEARAQLRDTIFGPVRDASRSRERVLTQRTGSPRVSFQVQVQSGAVFMIFANGRGSSYPLAAAGTWIIKRSMTDGSFQQAKVFVQDDEGTYVRLTPDGDRTVMDVVLFDQPFQSHVALPVAFDSLVTSPFSRIMDLSRTAVDWGLVLAPSQDEADRRIEGIAATLRARLAGLRDMDDGAMDDSGRMVTIANGAAAGSGGFNCSGFAKWVVDGFFAPIAGHPMAIAPLKARDAGIAKTWSSRYEELYDPYFGLDWTRGLAKSIGQARNGVTPTDEEVDVRDDSRIPYIRDVGYPMGSLKAELYFLARREPGVMYLGSVNAPSALAVAAGMPTLRQHHHVVVLLPYFDSTGAFHVVVMERNLETGIPSLQRRYGTEYVNLVRITTQGDFQLPFLPPR